ncbi:glucose-6-phosphate dehydrogenase [Lacisediminihabitans changchengi]|uniref:Glucose-6-phosphate 1-dehydrogenase n=1 Tax=Lacisediminihabitans changchengi TaxID=2787634 RepID=A0A934W2A7_9MICO|nr:glucose-6-phosphate dehydrogenase (NADP(+)) [Lacisediminihabitans changchengi]MBK4347718.1 glucose-6-phosphate dehydrogenase (NADP(+)) [Lacisediminihabitans changchengi]
MPDSSDAPATVFVLFGATGDLAKRMVIPAFYQLAQHGLLPKKWAIVGNGRGDVSTDDFRAHVHDVLTEFGPQPGDDWDDFSAHLHFAGKGFTADDPGELVDVLAEVEKDLGEKPQLIHYLSLPPVAFIGITEALGAHDLVTDARVVYEKPFGTSPDNFRELDTAVHKVLDEHQVFRIDHFLGKEGSQNLHALRFGNGLFEGVWSREHIRAVQIDVPETLGIDDRAEFYDQTGALLDMIVTHLFQLAAEIAMEPPLSMKPDDLQAARETVIAAFRPLAAEDVVLGQFDGFTETEGVASDSTTDTFAAARLWIDTPRWRDVPFLLRTGKRLAEGAQRVSIIFRTPATGPLAHDAPETGNVLSINLAGKGAVDLRMVVKEPGAEFSLTTAQSTIMLGDVGDADSLPPYVKLLNDVILGDRSLFTRPDGLAWAWDAIAPILTSPPPVLSYAEESWGPAEAATLAAPDGWLVGE